MKVLVITLLVIAAVSGNRVAENNSYCQPGSIVKTACNECVCSADGTEMACSVNPCPKRTFDVTYKARFIKGPGPKACESGEKWDGLCHSCICLEDGLHWGCNLKGCPSDARYCLPNNSCT